jgi:hypothetical protein
VEPGRERGAHAVAAGVCLHKLLYGVSFVHAKKAKL